MLNEASRNVDCTKTITVSASLLTREQLENGLLSSFRLFDNGVLHLSGMVLAFEPIQLNCNEHINSIRMPIR